MLFSRAKMNKRAIDIKIRRAKVLSKGNISSDFDVKHVDWVRDAQKKNFTLLVTDITKKTKAKQLLAITRREKLYKK